MTNTIGHRTELNKQEFEELKVKVIQKFGRHVFEHTNFTINEAWDELLLQMEIYVLGQHNYQKYTVMQPIPDGWWECFKEERMPQWFIKRHPIKRKFARHTITFDHKKLFPKSNIILPPGLGPVVFHSSTTDPGVHQQ